MDDVRDAQMEMWERTFTEGMKVWEGIHPWIIWGVVHCNKRTSVVMTRLHDGQLRAVWADFLNRKINDPENKWTLEEFDPATLIHEEVIE